MDKATKETAKKDIEKLCDEGIEADREWPFPPGRSKVDGPHAKRYRQIKALLSEAVCEAREWVKCSERLPESEGWYPVLTKWDTDCCTSLSYFKDGAFVDWCHDRDALIPSSDVLMWLPALPSPPQDVTT